jgi:hypothetical protein
MRPSPAPSPAEFARSLLAAADASERRRRRRRRDPTADAISVEIKRSLLESAVADDPSAQDFERWLLEQCTACCGLHGASAVQAMALEMLDEWHLTQTVEVVDDWLASGAPAGNRV